MEQQSFNSTRLSLAIGDLPLTPFGMRSPFAKIIEVENPNNKYKKIEDKCYRLTKLSSHHNQYSPEGCNNSISNPQITIQTNSKKFQNVNKIRRKVGNKITSYSEEIQSENISNTVLESSRPESNENLKCSESYLTDIDDGNFVEFNEATGLPNDGVVMNEFHSYYTCLTQNETKFSTSSKLANAEVAFRKFVDKAANSACLTHIKEKEIVLNKQTIEFPFDETVIVASENIIVKNNQQSIVMNSTMKPFGIKASDELPDLSSLTLEELPCPSLIANVNDPVGQRNSKISTEHVSSKVIFPAQISQQSLISEDVSISSLNESLTSSQRFAIYPASPKSKQVRSNTINNETHKFMERCHENLETEPKIDNGRIKEWILTSPFKSSSYYSHILNGPMLSKDELHEINYTCDISQNLHLQLSLDTIASYDELLPNPNGSVITIAKVARPPIENNSVTLTDAKVGISFVNSQTRNIYNKSNGSSSSGNLRSQESLANELCNMKKIISSSRDDEQSLIYSSDEDNIASGKVSHRISLSTPNLRNWEHVKLSKKYVAIEADANLNVPSVSKLCLRYKNEGTCTKTKGDDAYSSNLSSLRFNFKSNPCINQSSDSTSTDIILDVSLREEKARKTKFRNSLSFCDGMESRNNFQLSSKNFSDSIPSIDKFQQESRRNETILISDSSSFPQSSSEDEIPNKFRSELLSDFKDAKLPKKCNILSDNDDDVHKRKNTRIKFPVFKLSSDTDDDSESCNLKMQNSRSEVDMLPCSNFENDLMRDRPKQNLNNKVSVKKVNDNYLSSDSDYDFDAYVTEWKKHSIKKTVVHEKKNSRRKPKESSFLVDSDDCGEDVEFYLQQINRKSSNYLFTQKNEGDNLSLQKLSHTAKHDINCLEKEANTYLKTPPYRDNANNLTTLQILSSDSESDNCANIFHSRKPPKSKIKLVIATPKLIDNTLNSPLELQRKINKPLSFLASLSLEDSFSNAHPDTLIYLKNFKKNKETLSAYLFDYYNKYIFDYKLPKTMKITWNVRLTKTAGLCFNQIDKSSVVGRAARIEMSVKVCDGPERLRDTLIHELCHAAAWIISGCRGGHGKIWRAWASKAMRTFPELPIIDRCHTYEIKCKYTYRCVKCGQCYGRHSKSLNMERKVCGRCKGQFELIVNNGKKPENATTTVPRTPNAFALFVKENYSVAKKKHSEFKHGDVMKQLSEEFRSLKTK